MLKTQALNITKALETNLDISLLEKDILNDVQSRVGFTPLKNIWRSRYWGKNLGAAHWIGKLNGQDVILKIQGSKTNVSEIEMINSFNKSNRSKLIHPPKILKFLRWNKQAGYEAIIMEYYTGKKVLEEGKIQNKKNIERFFECYKEYRENCIPTKPWLPRLEKENWFEDHFNRIVKASNEVFPNHPLKLISDLKLARRASEFLVRFYKDEELEFMHGHFSFNDLKYENRESKIVVLFSNLFWKWQYPYYDAVFAYHWFMYELNHVEGITPVEVENQRKIWLKEIYMATGANKSEKVVKLVNAALLERAIAGILIDCFLVNSKMPIAKYLLDSTRNEIYRLLKLL